MLDLMLDRWDINDVCELVLRVLYRKHDAIGCRLFSSVPHILAKMAKEKPGCLFDEISSTVPCTRSASRRSHRPPRRGARVRGPGRWPSP